MEAEADRSDMRPLTRDTRDTASASSAMPSFMLVPLAAACHCNWLLAEEEPVLTWRSGDSVEAGSTAWPVLLDGTDSRLGRRIGYGYGRRVSMAVAVAPAGMLASAAAAWKLDHLALLHPVAILKQGNNASKT
jgi:hypothetical protein